MSLALRPPTRGSVDPNIPPGFTFEYVGSILQHAILPIVTYVLASIGGWILTMKSSTISTLGEDYVTVGKAFGLSERRILTDYVGRNAMLPLVTRLAISIGFVVGGSVIVEELFQYPGLGRSRPPRQIDHLVAGLVGARRQALPPRVGVERRAFVAGPPAEHVPEPEEHDHRYHQEDDAVDIDEAVHSLYRAP